MFCRTGHLSPCTCHLQMRPALLRPMRKTMTPSELPNWGQCSQPAGWQVLCRVSSEFLPSCQVSHVAPCGIMRGEVDMGGHTLGCIRPREVIGDPASTRSRAPLEVRKGSPSSPTASELLRRVRNLLPSCRQLVGGILVSKLACWCCAATLGPTCSGQAQRSQVLPQLEQPSGKHQCRIFLSATSSSPCTLELQQSRVSSTRRFQQADHTSDACNAVESIPRQPG